MDKVLLNKIHLTALVVFMVCWLMIIVFTADQVPDWLKLIVLSLFAGSGLIAASLTVYKIWA